MANLTGQNLCHNYYLRRLVGSGGMADVYEAWDQKRSTRMALKVLRRDLAHSSRFIHQFTQEAELLRKLSHPNIVRLYGFEKSDQDEVFIVMEWVDGMDLRNTLVSKNRPFTLGEVSQILQPVCVALNYAHQNDIYHCDVKTPNILLPKDGRVLLTDFGVARFSVGEVQGGTQYYMAPEQFNGGNVDARTDIYALGVTIFELLSGGTFPFRGESPDSKGSTSREKLEWEHNHLPLPPLSRINPAVPVSVENVVATAMKKDPRKRYSSTFELLTDFQKACLNYNVNLETRIYDEGPTTAPGIEIKADPPPHYTRQKIQGPYLFCRSGKYANQEISIPKSGLTIGRSEQCQLILNNSSVSRNHAHIICGRRGIYLEDSQSKLGTFVNNDVIQGPFLLQDGDIIQIGYGEIFEFKM